MAALRRCATLDFDSARRRLRHAAMVERRYTRAPARSCIISMLRYRIVAYCRPLFNHASLPPLHRVDMALSTLVFLHLLFYHRR